ncbi:MAG: response regulator [Sedimentisphaerales bacterium]|nr:response regulator [Sedimentisphaerales bacterium]
MAAATGELKWEDRYRRFAPQLDDVINEIKRLAPGDFLAQAVTQTDTTNIKLVAMENQSFDLVRQGNLQTATQLLYSQEYEKQKRFYAEGMGQYITALQNHIEDNYSNSRDIFLVAVIFVAFIVSLLFFSWIAILQMRRRFFESKRRQRNLKSVNSQLRAFEQQLGASNQQLNVSNQQLRAKEQQMIHLNQNLNERIKELDCLYSISKIVESGAYSLENILRGVVEIIPPSWQYPEITCAKISFRGQEYKTKNFRETDWKQSCGIFVNGQQVGAINVCCLEQKPHIDEGQFLAEERKLLNSVGEQLGHSIERIEMHNKLQATNQQLRELVMIVEQTEEGVALADLEGNLRFVNTAWAKMHGYRSGDELVGKNLSIFHTKEQLEIDVIPINSKVKCNGSYRAEVGHMRKDGSVFPTEMLSTLFKDETGKPVGLIGLVSDISLRKKAEEKIKYLAKFPSENPNPVLRIAKAGEILYSNKAGEQLLSKWKTGIGKTVPGKWRNLIAKAYNSQKYQEEEEEEVNKKTFLLSITPVVDANYVNIYGRNITEYKQAIENLEYAKTLAETANKVKGQFLANMSHEIRTPMNSIIGFSEILAAEELNGEQKDYLNRICIASESLLTIINDILDFSKIEAGKMTLEKIKCPFSDIISYVDSLMRPAATAKNINLEFSFHPDLPANIVTDPVRLRQCLINLISNAIKFTKEGQVRIETSIEFIDKKPFLRFAIKDTGVGIPLEKQRLIFDAFSQADNSTTREFGGTGLGLAITRRIVGLLGGEITLNSEPNVGSVFAFTVPANINIKNQPKFTKGKTYTQKSSFAKQNKHHEFSGNVLVAEDNQANQILVKTLLAKVGIQVTLANDGLEAVEKATTGDFDLIFMDMQMPNMNGYEATRVLRKKKIKTPIVAFTAHAMCGDQQKCQQAGCDNYLPKPVDYNKLIEILTLYLQPKKGTETTHNDFESEPQAMQNKTPDNLPLEDSDLVTIGQIFIDKIPETVKFINSALHDSDMENLALILHDLKGASGSVGLLNVMEKAAQVEDFVKTEQLDTLRENIKELIDLCQQVTLKDIKIEL